VHPGISGALYVLVALIWLIPDKRIERVLVSQQAAESSGDADGELVGS
jgi:uncharacterized membrane protein